MLTAFSRAYHRNYAMKCYIMFLQHQVICRTSEVRRRLREENMPYFKFTVSIYNIIQAIICAWMLIFPLYETLMFNYHLSSCN